MILAEAPGSYPQIRFVLSLERRVGAFIVANKEDFLSAVAVQPFEQLPLNLVEPVPPTLDNFVVGANGDALAALRACRQGQGPQFIYLWGPPGSGRTHLLRALTPLQGERVPEWMPSVKLYTVDDVEKLTEEELESLFHLMNAVRSDPQSRLVTAGGKTLAELQIREDVRSRLSWGLVFGLQCLDDAEANAEFHRQAEERGITLSPEVLQWIDNYCPRDMKSLHSLLDQIDSYSMMRQRRITVPLLHEWLENRQRERRG